MSNIVHLLTCPFLLIIYWFLAVSPSILTSVLAQHRTFRLPNSSFPDGDLLHLTWFIWIQSRLHRFCPSEVLTFYLWNTHFEDCEFWESLINYPSIEIINQKNSFNIKSRKLHRIQTPNEFWTLNISNRIVVLNFTAHELLSSSLNWHMVGWGLTRWQCIHHNGGYNNCNHLTCI